MKSRLIALGFILSVIAAAQTIVGLDPPKPAIQPSVIQKEEKVLPKAANAPEQATTTSEVRTAAVPSLGQWGKTKWGMSKAELEAAYPGQITTGTADVGDWNKQ